ncbi:putative reverse transcriptase domain-containing protein [Tanacetum coccineum]
MNTIMISNGLSGRMLNRFMGHAYNYCGAIRQGDSVAHEAKGNLLMILSLIGVRWRKSCVCAPIARGADSRSFLSAIRLHLHELRVVLNKRIIDQSIEPSELGFRYEIEIASGQLVEIDKVIKGCKLEIKGHIFDIDLIPFGHGSFDVIIGMDWLSNHKAEIIYHEKVVRIPLLDGKVLRVLGERPKEKARLLMSIKASDKKQGEIIVVRDFLERSCWDNSRNSRTKVSFHQAHRLGEHRNGLVIHMLVEKRYPLTKEVLSQLLDLKLETKEDSTMALELIKFVKQQLEEFEDSDDDDLAKSDHEEAERIWSSYEDYLSFESRFEDLKTILFGKTEVQDNPPPKEPKVKPKYEEYLRSSLK